MNDDFFVEYYVDDGILVERQHFANGARCLAASASLAWDHFRLFGERHAGDPPLLSSSKVSPGNKQVAVLGWEIDTVAMTISLPAEKLTQLHNLLAAWPAERTVATTESEFRTLIRKLLHGCGVVRPGKYFVRRMLLAVGLDQIEPGTGNTERREVRQRGV